jgi:signal transduction histidine kinase
MFNNFKKTKQKISANDNTSGIGLGLFYCKTMMTRLGGTIDVRSEVNRGAVFTLNFKASSCDDDY